MKGTGPWRVLNCDATCFRSCVCAMAWRFHAIDATLPPWPRRLDGVEALRITMLCFYYS